MYVAPEVEVFVMEPEDMIALSNTTGAGQQDPDEGIDEWSQKKSIWRNNE